MRKAGALVFLLFMAACGKPLGGPAPTTNDYKLYEAAAMSTSQQLVVIDTKSHAVERSLPLGALFAATHLYTIQSRTLLDIDPQSGASQSTLQLPGQYQLPPITISGIPGGLSQNGQWLVVESFDGAANSLPTETHMLVIDTTRSKVANKVDLRGDFQYDAVSNDGQRLYLIEYLNPNEYRVRLFDLLTGKLSANIVFDKADGNQSMAGLRLSGVASPDGHWLYSMYVREHESPFIHALSMDGPFAFCIDLPGSGYASPNGGAEFRWSLALSRDGTRLYAANGQLGLVADVEPATNHSPAIKRMVKFDTGKTASRFVEDVEAKEIGANGAAVTPDGRSLILSGGNGIALLDTGSLRAREHDFMDWTVWSLALSTDGSKLYVVNDGGTIAEMTMADRAVTKFSGAPGQPIALLRVAGGGS